MQENRMLYYTDYEYREFRRDYYSRNSSNSSNNNKRDGGVVTFHADVVTAVHEIPAVSDPSDLYYSESDLQGYVQRTSIQWQYNRAVVSYL